MVDLFDLLSRYMPEDEAKKTTERWHRWITTIFQKEDPSVHYHAVSKSSYNQLVVVKNIHVVSCCPHHLLPVVLRVNIGYLPDKHVLGLSKFVRVARALSSPRLQEDYTDDLVVSIMNGLKPKWAMVVVDGQHQCMSCRGVFSKDSSVVTSAIRRGGSETTEDRSEHLKQEFLKLIRDSI